MRKETKTSKRPLTQFSFCPRHGVFYKSCRCPLPGSRKKEVVLTEMEDINEDNV